MSATTTTAGPYYTSGSISFSSLRNNFREEYSGPIKASEVKRSTSLTNTNPIVPDCTENTSISTSVNLKLSQFRNSIKYYYITQTGTDINFDIDAQSWNSNLNKNIKKWLYINGTCGSNSTSTSAAALNADACNLTVDISGNVYGAGGSGGTSVTINGGSGGDALSIVSSAGNNIVISVKPTAKIYAGGGGGEKGMTGSQGTNGTCFNYQYYGVGSGCEWCGSCGDGVQVGGCNGVAGCDCFIWCNRTQLANTQCRRNIYYTVSGGAGGIGGDGGTGRGYNNLVGSLLGSNGSIGQVGSCAGYNGTSTTPGTGNTGETGGSGGDWALNGQNTSNSGSGGVSGKAISGLNYSVIGTINGDTIKGLYR